jgi:enoyl-CoA hydratase/carnithine racemase
MDLLLSARTFDAQEAHHLGFVHRILPADSDVLAAARVWAAELVQLPHAAAAAAKALILNHSHQSLRESYSAEKDAFLQLWAQPDHLEALAAFNEKRSPTFHPPIN